MTKQFQLEYIEFIVTDEASVLQKQWEPGWGDKIRTSGGRRGLVTGLELTMPHIEYSLLEITFDNGQCLKIEKDDLFWLPTLSDSLDMIEEAGWRWRAEMLTPHPATTRTRTEYVADAERGEVGHREYEQLLTGSAILSAAKVAVRVLEKVKND